MSRYISVGSNGDSSIPSYEIRCSQRTTSINFSTLASFTSIVSYMFRRNVVRVCAIRSVSYASAVFHLSRNIWSALHAAVTSERCGISSAVLYLVYQHRYCHQEFPVAFCCAVAQFLLLDGLKQVAFGRWGPVSAILHTCIRTNGSPPYRGPFGARVVHVGIFVVFSFYRVSPTTLLGQESTLSAVVVVPIGFSTSPCMRSQLLQRCQFSIARVPSA